MIVLLLALQGSRRGAAGGTSSYEVDWSREALHLLLQPRYEVLCKLSEPVHDLHQRLKEGVDGQKKRSSSRVVLWFDLSV